MKCPGQVSIKDPRFSHTSMIAVPCGKCGACRYNRRVDWTFRLKEELKIAKSAFFITLTYSDDKLPVNSKTGEITLVKSHMQNWLKKIRKLTNNKLRYYMVGEYGTKTDRPHYHIILFNLEKKNLDEAVSKWEFGNTHVGLVNTKSIHYVTKYHVNVRKGDNITRLPEYASMSRRPGIGANYIEKQKRWHKQNRYNYVQNEGYKQRLPRYYKERIFSKEDRYRLSQEALEQSDKSYNQEINRLQKLRVQEPHNNITKSERIAAGKVKDKVNKSNTF